MSIEFRCSQCGKLLRTGDDTVGRQAQCPECGALSTIPGLNDPAGATPPLAPLSSTSQAMPGNPFGSAPESSGARTSDNPYQSPGVAGYAGFGQPDPMAAQRLSAPATALIVTGVLGILAQVGGVLANLAQVNMGAGMAPRGVEVAPLMFGAGLYLVLGAVGVGLSILVIVGATKMKNLESYSLAMASAIIAMVPCTSPCCLLGLPFGIWALVVLNDSSVKAAFRS
jgi:hypothetical protein